MHGPEQLRMTPRHRLVLFAVPFAVAALFLALSRAAIGDTPNASTATGASSTDAPDESILGTVDVNGSSTEGLPPLPKMGVVPIVPTGSADSLVTLVVRHDMELRGQFDVQSEDLAPPGPFTHTTPLDLAAWRNKGAEYVLRVFSQPA